jgi:hypothetical protein
VAYNESWPFFMIYEGASAWKELRHVPLGFVVDGLTLCGKKKIPGNPVV